MAVPSEITEANHDMRIRIEQAEACVQLIEDNDWTDCAMCGQPLVYHRVSQIERLTRREFGGHLSAYPLATHLRELWQTHEERSK